ncbi:putative ribosomal protein [Kockovaella imperatae]|uniref:Putative ribosomal protein n=1 Tax=Kockovaella imperatae TaxID=4999 RepID=A0A1Y1UG94_9TREE|nr:putative ribosomal protein [Kockovaella imperatae]ORX37048.1 putative ribosomal protein [Kockovaella imperatae]
MSDAVPADNGSGESLSTSLAKLRRLTSSAQAHQAKPAQLLEAIESTLNSTVLSSSSSSSSLVSSGPSPTAYFVALLQCLEKACADEVPARPATSKRGADEEMAESENMGQGALIPATLYLLALVVPEAPAKVVASKIDPLMSHVLELFETAMPHPPALRSLIQISTSTILASTSSQLNSSPLLKKAWSYILELNLDPRPKVRHLAQEGLRKVLTTPIPPKMIAGNHPYTGRARDWMLSALDEESRGEAKGKKARFDGGDEGKKVIWLVQGLRGWVSVWGDEHLSTLCDRLLSLPPLPHLTQQIYDLLALLLRPPPNNPAAQSSISSLPTILESLLASPPNVKLSSTDVPSYLSAITSVLIKLSFQDPLSLAVYLVRALNLFMSILLDPKASKEITKAASEAIGSQGLARYCLTDDAILAAVTYHRQHGDGSSGRKKSKTPFLAKMIETVESAMTSHPLHLGDLLPIITALVSRLRLRMAAASPMVDQTGTGRTAAAELLLPLVVTVADLRVNPGFGDKEKLDDLLGMCFEVMGVEEVLAVLPLNIEPDASGSAPQPGRAHLLPLIKARTTNDSLAYFTSYFRPLSERLFSRKVAAEDGDRSGEAKIWETLVVQIWNCFPGFCETPRDLKEGLTTPFLTLLTNLLYTQPLLLTPLIRALSLLISSTERLASSATPAEELRKQFGLDQAGAQGNLNYLKSLTKDMVSVLLNVFSKLPRDQRGPVGDVIGLWVGIMEEADLVNTFKTVTSHLSSNLDNSFPQSEGGSPVSHTMLDLLIVFTPFLASAQSSTLFNASASKVMLEHQDATVQKKTYRLLNRLIDSGKVGEDQDLAKLVEAIRETEGSVGPGTQRDRLQLISTIVHHLGPSQLHLVPELLSEAVLGTKEINERARDAGFDLLVVMAHKMSLGGTISRQAGVDLEADDEMDVAVETLAHETVHASVEEFITMVAAGLTSSTPHMISASINALSRLVFEYHPQVSTTTLSELVSTTAVFLQSKNREIVKSALGFIKLLTITLPPNLIVPHLPTLVPALLGWVHDHKNHFKQKTIHIFERMIRKFGYDAVYKCAPEGGERKVLEGIKKRKDKAKRKKAKGAAEEVSQAPRTTAGNAFEDVLYNSDSESESAASDDDEPVRKPSGKQQLKSAMKKKPAPGQGYIRAEGDQPLDLLSRSIAGGVSKNMAKGQKRQPGQDASHFKTDKSGRLVIQDSDSDGSNAGDADEAGAGRAFLAAQRGVDGQTRTASGSIKFARGTKRAKGEDAMDMDDERPAAGGQAGRREQVMEKRKKMAKVRLGDEFRAKRGGGDIKRLGGPDPYSYVSLGQANARKGGNRVNLTNKKKGSRR